jgi:YD repeat-containing protein
MTTITASDALRFELAPLTAPTEIRDGQGNLLGHFTPDAERIRQLYEQAQAHFDPEELKERKAAGNPGLTLAEIFEHIRLVESGKCAGP